MGSIRNRPEAWGIESSRLRLPLEWSSSTREYNIVVYERKGFILRMELVNAGIKRIDVTLGAEIDRDDQWRTGGQYRD